MEYYNILSLFIIYELKLGSRTGGFFFYFGNAITQILKEVKIKNINSQYHLMC